MNRIRIYYFGYKIATAKTENMRGKWVIYWVDVPEF
jgi:hypothetical protein